MQLALAVDSHNRRAPTEAQAAPPAQALPSQPVTSTTAPTRPDNLAAAEFSDL